MSGIRRFEIEEGGDISLRADGNFVNYNDHAAEIARLSSVIDRAVSGYGTAVGNHADVVDAYCEAKEEIARLRAEADALRKIISPFAEYERVRSAMGGNSPKEGILLGVHSSAGSAELTVEDFKCAQAAMGADV